MTQKKAPQKAPKKKYYKTKNDVIEELKSELEAAEFLHREQIAKMQIEHQEELDAARHKDEEVFNLTDDLFEEKEKLIDELNMIKQRRFSRCNEVTDVVDHLSPYELAELVFYASHMFRFGLAAHEDEDGDTIVNPLEFDLTDKGTPAIWSDNGKAVLILAHTPCPSCEDDREMH
tara:strand:- start:45 stop:569 length:525 start_codon:yes stop_codon:yes gene_type:complete